MNIPNDVEGRRSALAHVERLRSLSDTERDMIRLASEPGFRRWLEQIRAIGGCAHPVYLSGHTTIFDAASGTVLRHYDTSGEPGGRMAFRCRNRRQSRCSPCSYLHAGDTFQLVRSGLAGGKGIPSTVGSHPRLFVTLTAPSFGAVHRAGGDNGGRCRARRDSGICEHGVPIGCNLVHAEDDPLIGHPLCGRCYDYPTHVLWHAHTRELWGRFVRTVRRYLASAVRITQTRLAEHARVSFAKVAEYQKRGAVHFHAVIRLDGPHGPGSTPPVWGTTGLLNSVVCTAAGAVVVRVPYSPALGEHLLRFGGQLDVHPIRAFRDGSPISQDAVAAYVAKYVGKSVGDAGGVDQPVRSATEIPLLPVSGHVRALMGTCWRLGGLPELEHLRLRAWTHTLGYRGHALTKSRRYSTTYTELRAARAAYRRGDVVPAEKGGQTVTESEWRYVGSGHTPAETEIAAGIEEDAAVQRAVRSEIGREIERGSE